MMGRINEYISDNSKEVKIASVVLVGLVLVSPILANNFLLGQQKLTFEANAEVVSDANNSTKLGVAAGKQGLAYGKISSGTNSTRFVKVSSEKKASLELSSTGNISRYLDYEESMVIKEPKNVSVEFESGRPGNYTGKLFIKAEYGKGALGNLWMDIKHP